MSDRGPIGRLLKPILFTLLVVMLAGSYAFRRMPTSLFPELTFPKITLLVDNGQVPVERMMVTVTKPIESAVKRVRGVQVVRTSTSRGSTVLQAWFTWETDIQAAKTQIESRINEIRGLLPAGTSIVVEPMDQSMFPVMGYTLESTTHDLVQLRNTALYQVRPALAQAKGLANVIVRGGRSKEYVVVPDAVRMSMLGVTPTMVATALANTNAVQSNGMLADHHRLYLTLTDTRFTDGEDLKHVVLRNDGLRVVRLGDIATIELREQEEFTKINANGHEGVLVDLVKQKGVDLIAFADEIHARLPELQAQLPKGMVLKPYYDQSAFVNESIGSVLHSLYEGLALALIVVVIFLRSFRASLVVVLIIPVILGLTVVVVHALGLSLNIMSLGAIAAAIGLIIDDAIVIVEQLHRIQEEHPEADRFSVVRIGIHDLFPAMVGSSLSTIVIFLPFALMSGVAGSFFKELSLVMQVTLVCSFFVTWIGVPALHLWFGHEHREKKKEEDGDAPKKEKLRWLTWTFSRPAYALVFIAVLAGGAWFSAQRVETGFLPDLDEGTIVLDYFSPPGTSLQETDRMLKEVDAIILAHPDVASYSRRLGIRMAFNVVPANYGDYLIQLKPGTTKKTVEVIDELRRAINAAQPVLKVSFGQRIADLLGDLIGSAAPIEIKLFGDDQKRLEALARQAAEILQRVPGIDDVNAGLTVAGPNVAFYPDAAKLAQYGISLPDFQLQLAAYTGGVLLGPNAGQAGVNPALAAYTGGLQAGQVQEGERMVPIRMRFRDLAHNDVEVIKQQPIFLPNGILRPVSAFARVEVIPGEVELKREDLKRDLIIEARLNGRDLGGAIADIKRAFAAELALPQGYSVVYGGAYAEQQASFRELLTILFMAALLVFAVLLFLFRDFAVSASILLIALLGIGGSLVALWITGVPLNVGSYTGIIMIVGILAENAIFTVNQFFTTLKERGDVDSALRYSISVRIRPKLMTAIGAILALIPLALGIGVGAQMQQPLAVAVIGGFISGLPLLLFVFPSLLRVIFIRRKHA